MTTSGSRRRASHPQPGRSATMGSTRCGSAGSWSRPPRRRRSSSTSPATTPTRSRTPRASSCTFRVHVDDEAHHRCYSMSSAPEVDGELQVTVKRVPGGIVSNRLVDTVREGGTVEVSVPAGVFRLDAGDARAPRVQRRQRHHADHLAGQVRAGDHRPPGAPLLRQPRPRRGHLRRRARRARRAASRPPRGRSTTSTSTAASSTPTRCARSSATPSGAEHYICGPTPFMDIVETGPARLGRRRRPHPHRAVHARRAGPRRRGRGRHGHRRGRVDRQPDHDRARRPHRHRRAPTRHHDPADRPPDGHVAAVLVRVGHLRHLHGPAWSRAL